MFTEVGIAGRSGPSKWRTGSSERRLDGVRLLDADVEPNLYTRTGSRRLLSGLPAEARVELIEVKQGLSKEVLGQCLVGRDLFAEQYPQLRVVRTVALCKVADPRLRDLFFGDDDNWDPDEFHVFDMRPLVGWYSESAADDASGIGFEYLRDQAIELGDAFGIL